MLSINAVTGWGGGRGTAAAIYLTFSPFLFFSFSFFLSATRLCAINSEGLYQLGVQRCPPQSSIEGLEDTEVGSNSLPAYLPAAKNIVKD